MGFWLDILALRFSPCGERLACHSPPAPPDTLDGDGDQNRSSKDRTRDQRGADAVLASVTTLLRKTWSAECLEVFIHYSAITHGVNIKHLLSEFDASDSLLYSDSNYMNLY